MKKNGFTLIELLAVIVILAIIALIATPIILGIINDARKEANERSVELYASAVRNAIASYQLTNPNAPTSFDDLDIEHDGEVECTTQELYADGSFYITDCTVNGVEVDYTYGEQQESSYVQVYKPQYYTLGSSYVYESVPQKILSVPPTDRNVFIGIDVTEDLVSAAYVCFFRNNTEYCLKGYDDEAFETNKGVLEDAFGKDVCYYEGRNYKCSVDGLDVIFFTPDDVSVSDDKYECIIDAEGYFDYFKI